MDTPQSVPLGTEAYAEALERKRQELLASSWRPKKCAVPWTPSEEDSYREASLHNTALAASWPELVQRGEVDPAIAMVLAPGASHERYGRNVVTLKRALEVKP